MLKATPHSLIKAREAVVGGIDLVEVEGRGTEGRTGGRGAEGRTGGRGAEGRTGGRVVEG